MRKWDALGLGGSIEINPLQPNSFAWQDLKDYGAIVFRGFEISKDKQTFGQVTWIQRMTFGVVICPSPSEYFDIPTSP